MVIAALLSFAALFVAWLVAPNRRTVPDPKPADRTLAEQGA